MQKVKEYLAIRAVRLGVMAVLVATFVGLPSLKYYTGVQAFEKLDVIEMAANVFLAQEMPPPNDGGSFMPPPNDGGSFMPPPNDGGSFMPPPNDGGSFMPPPNDGGSFMPPPNDGGFFMPQNGLNPANFRGDQAGCQAAGFYYDAPKNDCFPGQPQEGQFQPQSGTFQPQEGQFQQPLNQPFDEMKEGTEPPKFEYAENKTLPIAAGAVDDLRIDNVTVKKETRTAMVKVCSATESKNNIGYYIIRAELAENSRIGITQYVQNKTLNPGACAEVELALSGLRNANPGQHYNLDVRLRNDEANLRDMNRGNDQIFMNDICVKDEKFVECGSDSTQMGPQNFMDPKNLFPQNPMDQKGPFDQQNQMNQPNLFGAASDMGPQAFGQFNGKDPASFRGDRAGCEKSGFYWEEQMQDCFPGKGFAMGPQPQFGLQFGDQNFKSQYDFASDFGAEFNQQYSDFQTGFGEYNFGDEFQMKPMNAGDINRDKNQLASQLKNQEEMSREFGRMAKRIDRFVQEIGQQQARVAKDKERAAKQGGNVAEFDSAAKVYDTILNLVKGQIAELEVLKNLYASDYASVKAKIESLGADSSSQEVEGARADARKLETYWTIRDAMDNRVSTLEQLRMPYDFLAELSRLRGEYSRAGTTMNAEISSGLAKFESSANGLLGYREQAKNLYDTIKNEAGTIRGISDPQGIDTAVQSLMNRNRDINNLRQKFQKAMMEFNGGGGNFGPQNGPEQGGFGQDGSNFGPQGGSFGNGPFDMMGRAWEGLHSQKFAGDMKNELINISQELQDAKKIIEILKSANIQNSKVQRAIQDLSSLADEGVKVMSKMKAFLDAGKMMDQPGQMDQFWQVMDKIGMSADRSMQTIRDYFKSSPNAVAALGADADFVLGFLSDSNNNGQNRGPQFDNGQFQEIGLQAYGQKDFGKFKQAGQFDNVDDFNNARMQFASAYDGLVGQEGFDMDALVAQIRADVIQEVTRKVTAEVMSEVSKHVGDEVAGKILNNVMNNLGNFGDRGEKLLENTSKVLDVVATVDIKNQKASLIASNPELKDEMAQIEELIQSTKSTAIAESTQEEMGSVMDDVRVLIETGGDEKEFQTKIAEAKRVLAKNDDALVFEEGVKFKDTGLGENWFDGYVTGARQQGIVSGFKDTNGKLTGEYGPSNNVTKAEALKMALEAAGEGAATGAPRDGSAQGQWYAGYVKQAENLGFDIAQKGGWNEPADRETVAVLVSQAFDLGGKNYDVDSENFFPDVSANNPHAGDLQAVRDFGIFTGDGSTGNLRPNDGINRAEVAKVMSVAMENAGDVSQTLNQLDLNIEVPNSAELKAQTEHGDVSIPQKKVSFWDFLKAMIPLLW